MVWGWGLGFGFCGVGLGFRGWTWRAEDRPEILYEKTGSAPPPLGADRPLLSESLIYENYYANTPIVS